jgi:hypothetical protein
LCIHLNALGPVSELFKLSKNLLGLFFKLLLEHFERLFIVEEFQKAFLRHEFINLVEKILGWTF